MPYHQEGGRDSRGIPEFECIPEEEQQAYLNAIEPFMAKKGQKIGACGGLFLFPSLYRGGLNAFAERIWPVYG